METLVQGLIVLMGVVIVVDLILTTIVLLAFRAYIHRWLREHAARTPDRQLPPAAIILALRGPDPGLTATLESLVDQNYPDFVIHLVVDSETDPVLEDVHRLQDAYGPDRIQVSFLSSPGKTCSLKCSSLIQAIREIDDRYEIFAFIDGDASPHRNWLRDLAVPLVRGEGDVAGGNRWYLPPCASWGAMTRYFWNAAFMVAMWGRRIPWAGTMAIKRQTVEDIGLLDAWQAAMSVDVTLHRLLDQHHKKFVFVPTLLMVNREDISSAAFIAWVSRQMAVARYSSSETRKVLRVIGAFLLSVHIVVPALAIAAFTMGPNMRPFAWLAAGCLPFFWITVGLRSLLIENGARKAIAARGDDPRWVTPSVVAMWLPALILVHLRVFQIIGSMRTSSVCWRGITYHLHEGGRIEMEAYFPYENPALKPVNHSVL
jgi:hypothetical protein